MKLGSETGSLINNVYSQTVQTLPQVGDGATIMHWTDRSAGTVISVDTAKNVVVVQEDTATLKEGCDTYGGSQDYDYSPNPNGPTYTFKPVSRGHRKGQMREGGRKDGYSVVFGRRDKHRDPSF